MKRCKRCILPSSYPGITFNKGGICSFCANFKKLNLTPKKDELRRLMQEAKRSSKRYQAIVPISGGKDSAYALYVMRRIYGLRVLAINFDNGFRSLTAETNLNTLTTQIGVDYISIKPSWDLMRELYATFVKITGEFCSVCNSMGYLTIMSFIMKHINKTGPKPLTVGGWARHLEAMPGMYSFDLKYFYDIVAQGGMSQALRRSEMVDELCLDKLINMPDPRLMKKDEDFPLKYIMLPEFMDWDLRQITKTLKKEVGWISPPDAEDETHFDCVIYPVAQYFERQKYGFSQNTVTYSALVRDEQISRDEALKKIRKEKKRTPVEFSCFLNMLGLEKTDVNWEGKWHPQRQ